MLCKMNNTLRGRTNGTSTLNGYSQPLWAKHTAGPASPGPAAAAGASLASGADGGARGTGGAPLGNAALGPPAQAALGPTRPRRTGLAPGTTEGPGRGRVRAAQPLGRPLRMRGGGAAAGPGRRRMPGAASTARPAPAGPPGASRRPSALTGEQAAGAGGAGVSLGAACGRFSFCSSMAPAAAAAAAVGTAARRGAGRAPGPPLGRGGGPAAAASALAEPSAALCGAETRAAPRLRLPPSPSGVKNCRGRVPRVAGLPRPLPAPAGSRRPSAPLLCGGTSAFTLPPSALLSVCGAASWASGHGSPLEALAALWENRTRQTPYLRFHVPLLTRLTLCRASCTPTWDTHG